MKYAILFLLCIPLTTACPDMSATNTQEYLQEIDAIDAQLEACPVELPASTGLLIRNGNVRFDISMRNGSTETLNIEVKRGDVIGISRQEQKCAYTVTFSEDNFDRVLASEDKEGALATLYAKKQVTLRGCTATKRMHSPLLSPIMKFFLEKGPVAELSAVPDPVEEVEEPEGEPVVAAPGEVKRTGKPDHCTDVSLIRQQGYIQNQDLWRQYSDDTEGVCAFEKGYYPNEQCVYSVQLVKDKNEYFLCWYMN